MADDVGGSKGPSMTDKLGTASSSSNSLLQMQRNKIKSQDNLFTAVKFWDLQGLDIAIICSFHCTYMCANGVDVPMPVWMHALYACV